MAPIRRNLMFLLAAFLLFTLCLAANEVELSERSSLNPRAFSKTLKHRSDKVHGTIMGLAVVVIFPLGAISWKLLDRVLSPRSLLLVHVVCQVLGLALLITGFGVGVWVAILHAEVYNDPLGHVILGTIIVGLFLIQPIIGTLHHRLFKAEKSSNVFRKVHIWFGRVLLILAIINGGLGLNIGNNSPGGEKAYEALSVIIGVVYLAVLGLWYFNRSKSIKDSQASSTNEIESGDVEGQVKITAAQKIG